MIGYSKQHITEADINAVVSALRGDLLTCGPWVEAFEAEVCRVTGAPHAVAVANGTSALRLLYQVAGVGPGKRVGIPAITFVATASQAMLLGAEPVLLDVDPHTLCLTPQILADCQEHLDVVVPVHMGGRLCEVPELRKIGAERGIVLLEDAAHAYGSQVKADVDGEWIGAFQGSRSLGATFSFHPVKNVTTGEGGAITVSNPAWADRLRSLRHHGIERQRFLGHLAASEGGSPWYHEFHRPATNERLDDIACALGVSQSRRVAEIRAGRAAIVERYRRELPAWIAPPAPAVGQQPCWHLCAVQVDWQGCRWDRLGLFAAAMAAGIALQVHYIPLHHQPVLARATRASALDGADRAYAGLISLPCHPGLSDDDQSQVLAFLRAQSR
jgi:dTDP-4-amino-4,6-dideoxygalactose transaminase